VLSGKAQPAKARRLVVNTAELLLRPLLTPRLLLPGGKRLAAHQ